MAPDLDARSAAPVRRERVLAVVVGLVAVGLGLMVVGSFETPIPYAGWYLISAVAPAALLLAYRVGQRAVVVLLVLGALSLVAGFALRSADGVDPFHQRHDGGVVATEAAADMAIHLENPYAADFSDALAPNHDTLDAVDGDGIVNPLVEHYPYLPAAFLVHAPFALLGSMYDPRILYVVATAVAVWMVASGSQPSWRRAAALAAIVGNGALMAYLPWGANDAAAASLVVIAALVADRRSVLAGALVALGISLKALLVVAAIPLGVLWFLGSRQRAIRATSAAVGVLVVTCLPYFLASPGDFVDDTVRFNLGATDLTYPTSGVGLGAAFPGVVDGVVLLALSALLVAGAGALAVVWVRQSPRPEVALFAAGVLVLAGLLPARSFQISYFPLLVLLWGPIWRLSAAESGLDRFSLARH